MRVTPMSTTTELAKTAKAASIRNGLKRVASLLLLGPLGISPPALAQINGTVTEQQGLPIEAAFIQVARVSQRFGGFAALSKEQIVTNRSRAVTNANGDYRVAVSPGVHLLTASKDRVGLDAIQVAVGTGTSVGVDFRLGLALRSRMAVACARVNSDSALGPPEPLTGDDPKLVRLLRWLSIVHFHLPGCSDELVDEVARWSDTELRTLLADLKELSSSLQTLRKGSQADSRVVRLYGRDFARDHIGRVFHFHGNETLKRGAVLHADIAEFVTGDLAGVPLVEDAERRGWRPRSRHWNFGRQLLDLVSPSPTGDSGAFLWYRAISAHLLREGRLSEASTHLAKARQVFPEAAEFLLDSAYLHEEFASPAIQAARALDAGSAASIAIDGQRLELARAEQYFRQSLRLAPGSPGVRIRFGRTLSELGHHRQAVVELTRAVAAKPDKRHLYWAHLFLGRAEEALGSREEAVRHFHNAAVLYPGAQSPHLALALLARQAGDQMAALSALQPLTTRPLPAVDADPWWSYYQHHVEDAETLMIAMRKIGQGEQ